MKRSIIATAALLLLVSSATYAFPPRPRHRPRIVSGPELAWFACGHRHEWVRVERHYYREFGPPLVYFEWTLSGDRGCPGWQWGWDHGRRPDWDRHDWGGRRGPERPPERGRGHGRD